MRTCRAWVTVMLGMVVAGCAAGGRLAAPISTDVSPVIIGTGMPTAPAEPWMETPAVAASVVSAPLHALGCAGSALVGGVFYALFFPGDFSDDFKAWIGQNCAGPYLVTPAEVARVVQPFPIRTPRMGELPVEEALRGAAPRR